QSASDLKFARNSATDGSGTWSVTTVESTGQVGHFNSLEMVDGNPAISYYDLTNQRIRFARNSAADGSGTWTLSSVDSFVGSSSRTSLKMVDGKPAIAYYDALVTDLEFARNSAADGSGTWTLIKVAANGIKGPNCSLFVVDGRPAISHSSGQLYWSQASTADGSVTWTTTTVDAAPSTSLTHTSAAVIGGRPVIAYHDATNGDLKLASNSATNGSGTWNVSILDGGGTVGSHPSLAAVADNPAISYFDATNGDLKWALVSLAEIGLEQPAGTSLADQGVRDFGVTPINQPVTLSFTILNSGIGDLNGLAITKDGPDAADFLITVDPVAPVAGPDGNTTFIVEFSPTSRGAKTAAIHIASNDSDESPFDVTLTGTALSTNADLFDLSTNSGEITPAFDPAATTYTTSVEFSVASLAVTPQAAEAHAMISINDTSVTSGNASQPILLIVGVNNISVTVIAEDGVSTKTYALTVNRAGVPDIGVTGNDVAIASGDTNPTSSDHTDFGGVSVAASTLTRTFVIHNTGSAPLNLTGIPKVQLSGPTSSDFAITSQPASPIAVGESASFSITYDPSAINTRSAVVAIGSDDPEEPSYTFAVSGIGTAAGEVSFTSAIYQANQGDVAAQITLQRNSGSLPFDVSIETQNGVASTVPPFVPALAGTDYLALATTISFAEGEMTKTATIALSASKPTAPNKGLTISMSDPTEGATLGSITQATLQILANDPTKPTLRVTAPSSTNVSTTAPYHVTGIAGDARGISRVEIVLNGGSIMLGTLGAANQPTSIPFSQPILPVEGPNFLTVTAYDLKGNSTSVTRNFTFMQRYLLTLSRNDPAAGTVTLAATPTASASALTPTAVASNPRTSQSLPGATVKLTATPKTGFVFSHWLGLPGGATTLGNVATFAMPALDAAITANFVAAPFNPPAGRTNTFYGLLHPTAPPSTNANEGFLTGTLTATGAFTGKLFIDGVAQPITTAFYGDGSALFTVGAAKQTSLTFGGRTLTLVFDFGPGVINAGLVNGPVTSTGSAGRPLYSTANKVPAALLSSATATKGFYTVSLPATAQTPPVDITTYPQGHGFATLSLTNIGGITFTGILADGTAITGGSALLVSDTAPFLIQLPNPGASAVKGGSFSGVLAFDITPADSDVLGANLLWFRTAAVGTTAATNLYTPGWPNGIHVDAVGARYATATKVQATLGLPALDAANGNAQLMFTDGKLTADITKTNFNINGNTVAKIPTTDASFTLSLAAATGSFSGNFTPNWANPITTKPSFKGIMMQKGANKGGFGFFLSNAKNDLDPESGSVTLSAP
ncbi:MAG: choice-of-anchor D domain-containing protein, partial [Prosthecobacter sp.]|nr:choice-of-anchor D domain-containing protein [Prosthecobacter sp.]